MLMTLMGSLRLKERKLAWPARSSGPVPLVGLHGEDAEVVRNADMELANAGESGCRALAGNASLLVVPNHSKLDPFALVATSGCSRPEPRLMPTTDSFDDCLTRLRAGDE